MARLESRNCQRQTFGIHARQVQLAERKDFAGSLRGLLGGRHEFRLGLRVLSRHLVVRTMITEAEIIAALYKPRNLYAIQQLVSPGRRDTDELHTVLVRL